MADNTITHEFMGFLKGHGGMVTSIISGNSVQEGQEDSSVVVSGSRDKNIILWQIEGQNNETRQYGRPLKALTGHHHFVTDLSLTNDDSYLISSSWDKTMRLWNMKTCETKALFQSENKEINTVCFSKDNRYIFSGGCENQMMLWNTKGQKKADSVQENHHDWVSRVRFSPSMKHSYFASAGWDGRVKIWNGHFVNNGYFQAHNAPIYALAIANNGTFIATGSKDQTVRLFNINQSTEAVAKYECGSVVNDVAFNPMFRMLAAATDDAIMVWDITQFDSNEVMLSIPPEKEEVDDEEEEDLDNEEENVEEQRKEEMENQKGPKTRFTSMAWSTSGKFLYAGCSDGNIQVFKIEHPN